MFDRVLNVPLLFLCISLREKCPYLELFWFVFSRIPTEYGEMRSVLPCSVRMRKIRTRITLNTDTLYAVFEIVDI